MFQIVVEYSSQERSQEHKNNEAMQYKFKSYELYEEWR